MSNRHDFICTLCLLLGILLSAAPAAAQMKGGWLPITPEDLSLKEVPGVPGAHAVVLYRERLTDDVESYETNYYRIKILTEEGKKHGDVEILYLKDTESVRDIKARTIRPDGSVVEFDGKIFDKTVAKTRGVKFYAKAFTMPEVQAGGMIEYKYRVVRDESRLYSPYWPLQSEFFTRRVKFSFRPVLRGLAIQWTAMHLPPGNMPKEKGDWYILELENVPAFEEEEYMPPEREMRMRVEFSYARQFEKNPEDFWKKQGQELRDTVEGYIGKRGGIANAESQITAGAASPEEKLRKIYARVQQIRNLSYERERSEKEAKKEKLKENNNIEDVLKHGFGYRREIARLFVGLARSAGFTASIVHVAERDDHFFHKQLQDEYQLDAEVALVHVGDADRYFDPGMPNCPFGLLAWQKTEVPALKPGKDGGTWISTPAPASKDAVTERKAALRLTEDGTLQGKVEFIFAGLQAVRRRREAMEKDEVQRRKDMEDELKDRLPSSATVKVESVTGLEGSDAALKVEYSMEIQGYAAATGRRLLLPTSVFHLSKVHPFLHAQRKYPVYFGYPSRDVDDITIELPANYRIESLPQGRKIGSNVLSFEVVRENQGNKLRVRRSLALEAYYFPADYYPSLRRFYDEVMAGDDEQAVLRTGEAPPK
ncbi:MAG: DUF3857 domain-containing protein [Acidobacteria bacterium]|nr:DUF3857 domain-containing protein [Acidobacteriota bacterium]MBI3484387.1 DUF3857 domain-containing protein [Acidobacteriota bacterium]